MSIENINLNSREYPKHLSSQNRVNNSNNETLLTFNSDYKLTNPLKADTVSFTSNAKLNNDTLAQLKAELKKTKEEQGLIGKAWDKVKNLLGMKAGSSNVEKAIQQLEKGKITENIPAKIYYMIQLQAQLTGYYPLLPMVLVRLLQKLSAQNLA